ncbi:MAG: alkaline phosphatase family protein [Gemmatimonadales bacterium]
MTRPLLRACAVLGVAVAPLPLRPLAAQQRPKLVVMITVDQLRPDYLERWKSQLVGGFPTLVAEGAVFASAYQDHALTETAPGHATVLSGRWPAHTGILTNAAGVQDTAAPLLAAPNGPGASPRRFRGTAFFDWLKAKDPRARALSVSRKDRGAILPVGAAKEQVYWYQSGLFTTSRYYADSLPAWVRTFNARRVPFKAAGTRWTLLLSETSYPEPDEAPWENRGRSTFPYETPTDSAAAAAVYAGTPWMDSLTLAFALAGAEALRLGRRGTTDLLAVSLSSTDAIGHAFGPDSRELHDQVLRLDRYLGWFLGTLFRRYGRGGVLIALTADHGVTPYPEVSRQRGHADATRVSLDSLVAATNRQLDQLAGATPPRAWLAFDTGMLFLQDNGRLTAAGVSVDSVLQSLTARILAVPGVARVNGPAELARADTATDAVARRWLHHLAPDAGVVLVVTLKEYSVWDGFPIAMHGQPSELDAHVPLILWGRGVKPGTYTGRAATVDIAPTLARLLGLTPLSLLDGRVLAEALR